MTAPVGSVRLEIDGDASRFERELQRAVVGAMRDVQRDLARNGLQVHFELADLRADTARATQDAQKVADKTPITVPVDADTSGALGDVAAMRRQVQAATPPIHQQIRVEVDRGSTAAARAVITDTAAAERELQRAQRDSVAAENALVAARKRATSQLADIDLAVRRNAIAQREAAAAVAKARAELDALGDGNDPDGSLREAAALRVEKAELKVLEARRESTRLIDRATEATARLAQAEHRAAAAARAPGPSAGPVGGGDTDRLRVQAEASRASFARLGGEIGSVAATATKLGAVTAALAAIGGAAGLAGGAIGGLAVAGAALGPAFGAGIGTVVVGLQGMKDAFDAVAAASEAGPAEAEAHAKAVAAAQDQLASALDGAQSAQRSLTSAQRDAEDAARDIGDAYKQAGEDLEDLQFKLRGSVIDQKEAALAVRQAQRDLNKASDPEKREEALVRLERAQLRYDQALENGRDVAAEAAEAEAKGLDGNARVVAAKDRAAAANDRVAAAQDAVNRANAQVAKAQQAVTDAQNAATPSAEKLAQALAKLAPNAAAFVTAAQALAPAWDAVRKSVQDNLFEGGADTLRQLADAVLPSLQTGMGAVATELNLGARGFADFLSSGEGLAALDAVFASTAELLRGMRDGSDGFLSGLAAMVQAAQPFAQQIGAAFGSVASALGAAFAQIADSGLLGQVLDGFAQALQGAGPLLADLVLSFSQLAAQVLPALAPLFDSLGQTLVAISPALGSLGGVFARSLAEVLPSLGEFISALAQGVEPILPVLIELLKSLFGALEPLIEPLSQIAVTIGQALIGAIDALAPSIGPLGEAFAAVLNAVAPLIPLIAENLSTVIQALAPALTDVANALAPVIAAFAEQMRPVIEQLAPILAAVAATIGLALADALTQIAPVVPDLVKSFAALVIAVVPLLPELARLAAEILPPLIDVLVQLSPFIIRAIDAFTWLVQNVIIPLVLPIFQQMTDQLGQNLQFLADAFHWWNGIVDTVLNAVTTGWNGLSETLTGIKDWIVGTVFKALGDAIVTVQGWFDTGVRGIGEIWARLQEIAKAPVRFVIETIWNNGLLKAWNAVARFLPGVDEIAPIPVPFHRGGILPGYTPGRDPHRFISTDGRMALALSGGEGIARPEVVRALGSGRWDAMNAAARTGGVSGVRRFFGFASGGVIPSTMWRLISERFPAMQWTSGLRPGAPDFHGRNMAGDFATAEVPSAQMKALARWIFENYGPESLELIHWPLDGWQNIDNGAPFDFGQPTNDQHRSHVHWAMDHPPDNSGDKPGGVGGVLRETASRLFGSIRDRVADVFDSMLSGIADAIPAFGGAFGALPRAVFDNFRQRMREFLTGHADTEDDKRQDVPPGGNVEMFRDLVRDLLGHYRLPLSLTNSTLRRMQQESGGRTDAVNLWDVNAQNGTPSVGLMQVIRPTYDAYKDPAFDKGPYLYGVSIDPAANVSSSMRYALARYGSLSAAYDRPGGYQRGGLVPGIGSGDIVPALLEPQEIIMNRRAAKAFGPLLLSMNRAVPRFQNGGIVEGLVGGIGAVPVAVVNWDAARGVLGAAPPAAPDVSAGSPPPSAAPASPAAPSMAEAAAAAATAAVGAFGEGLATVIGDTLKAWVVPVAQQTAEQAEQQRIQAAAEFAIEQQRFDEQGRLLSDTNALLQRNASSQELVTQEQTEQLRAQLNEIANRLTGGVLAPIMQSAVDAAIQVVQTWLKAGFSDVVAGTDRTTRAVENIDVGGGGGAAPPFGAPGSAFDAASAISQAVVQVADTAKQAFMSVATDIAKAALAQKPSKVDKSRGVLGRDISGGPLVDMIVRLTGVEIQIRDVLINTLDEITDFRKDLFQALEEAGALVSDTAVLMQRNESSRDLVLSEQNRINRELIKAVLRYLIVSVVIPIMTAILGAMIQLAATAIGAAIGSIIPGIGTAIGAAIGAVIGAALAGLAAVFVSTLAIGAGAAIDSFDSGGVGVGKGLMVKATSLRERVLDPQETNSYDRLARIADMLEAPSRHTTTVHAPIYMRGGERDADRVADRLLALMPK
ncbi:hypothetical protein NDR87_26320 [Nocardia sp. CDC159]|uniref:Transglycosylase SLT domain-containing protein n=1 Tax=Nocardia pulmonis TaxID=2951408 RepID=A0A9X2E8A5_9NOCA|nr:MULTISPECIES: hypothetical protein [Nocardia]MCM6774963.1 hypothetical protein [Nocardia pulmonis]MCM6789894.1 hypothetical protein [Nocardia sp. CDC159]